MNKMKTERKCKTPYTEKVNTHVQPGGCVQSTFAYGDDDAAEKTHICVKGFNNPENRKLRGHCHYTGLYRGAAHNNCNLKYRIPDHIPIVFHNLSG